MVQSKLDYQHDEDLIRQMLELDPDYIRSRDHSFLQHQHLYKKHFQKESWFEAQWNLLKNQFVDVIYLVTKHTVAAGFIGLIAITTITASAAQAFAPEQYKPTTILKINDKPKDETPKAPEVKVDTYDACKSGGGVLFGQFGETCILGDKSFERPLTPEEKGILDQDRIQKEEEEKLQKLREIRTYTSRSYPGFAISHKGDWNLNTRIKQSDLFRKNVEAIELEKNGHRIYIEVKAGIPGSTSCGTTIPNSDLKKYSELIIDGQKILILNVSSRYPRDQEMNPNNHQIFQRERFEGYSEEGEIELNCFVFVNGHTYYFTLEYPASTSNKEESIDPNMRLEMLQILKSLKFAKNPRAQNLVDYQSVNFPDFTFKYDKSWKVERLNEDLFARSDLKDEKGKKLIEGVVRLTKGNYLVEYRVTPLWYFGGTDGGFHCFAKDRWTSDIIGTLARVEDYQFKRYPEDIKAELRKRLAPFTFEYKYISNLYPAQDARFSNNIGTEGPYSVPGKSSDYSHCWGGIYYETGKVGTNYFQNGKKIDAIVNVSLKIKGENRNQAILDEVDQMVLSTSFKE